MDVAKEMQNRLDMDNEIHQAISMARRINEKVQDLGPPPPHHPQEEIKEEEENVDEDIEDDEEDDAPPQEQHSTPSSSEKRPWWKSYIPSEREIKYGFLLFVVLLVGPLVLSSVLNTIPVWACLSNQYPAIIPVVKSGIITLVYVLLMRFSFSV